MKLGAFSIRLFIKDSQRSKEFYGKLVLLKIFRNGMMHEFLMPVCIGAESWSPKLGTKQRSTMPSCEPTRNETTFRQNHINKDLLL
jgi:hypothetical protein